MNKKKLIENQKERKKEIRKFFKEEGYRITFPKNKCRIEGEDRLQQKWSKLNTSACGIILNQFNNEAYGHFRYIEEYNRQPFTLQKRTYIIGDKNDRNIRLYDETHGRFHYHDYRANGKTKKKRTVIKVYLSVKDIIKKCISLLCNLKISKIK